MSGKVKFTPGTEEDGAGGGQVDLGSPTPPRTSLSEQLDDDHFTVEQAIDRIGFGKFQIKLSLVTGLAWMADSMEMMILSILSPALHCAWWLTGFQQALVTTVVFCGMMLSSSFWGWVCDKYGRKTELLLSALYTFYFGLLSAFSPTFVWMLVLRGLVGFGIGGAPQSVTMYSEFLPTKSRAKAIVLVELAWAIGAAFEVVLALIIMPTLGWRWLLIFSACPLIVFALACMWLPESARFNIASGDTSKALATIRRIANDNDKPMPLGKLTDAQGSESAKRGRWQDLFIPELRWTTILLWFIWFTNAFAYYGIVLMTTELFEGDVKMDTCDKLSREEGPADCLMECHELTTKDYTDLLWTTLAEFPGLFLTAAMIDRIGRKLTMASLFWAFSVFIFLLFICTERMWLTFFLFAARAFISGAFQAAYVYTPEIYPTVMRALGLGTCSGMARLGAIITPFVAQVLLRYSTSMTISIYAGVSVLAGIAALLLPIETKGRGMKDVQLTKLAPS